MGCRKDIMIVGTKTLFSLSISRRALQTPDEFLMNNNILKELFFPEQ
jgi:hypothetical protein